MLNDDRLPYRSYCPFLIFSAQNYHSQSADHNRVFISHACIRRKAITKKEYVRTVYLHTGNKVESKGEGVRFKSCHDDL